MRCPHTNFKANVTVHRSDDLPQRFYIEVHVLCGDCNMPFHFEGVPAGRVLSGDTLSHKKAIVTSPDGCELRVPIACGPLSKEVSPLMTGTEEQEFEALKTTRRRLMRRVV